MRKLTFSVFVPFAFVGATSLVACSFQMRAGSDPNNPNGAQSAQPRAATPATPAATPAGTPVKITPIRKTGRAPTPTPPSSSGAPAPSTPPPTGAAIVTGATIFGGSTVDPAGFKGSIFLLTPGLTAIPDLAKSTPNGFLFTSTINVTPQAFTSGFPGVDAARKENFAIRYEGPLVVGTESDYDFRVVAEDGAKLLIDGTPIVDNDGVKTAPAEKIAPVHLVVGTHVLTVDYLQTTGNVALQVFCKKTGGTEQVCPTKLP